MQSQEVKFTKEYKKCISRGAVPTDCKGWSEELISGTCSGKFCDHRLNYSSAPLSPGIPLPSSVFHLLSCLTPCTTSGRSSIHSRSEPRMRPINHIPRRCDCVFLKTFLLLLNVSCRFETTAVVSQQTGTDTTMPIGAGVITTNPFVTTPIKPSRFAHPTRQTYRHFLPFRLHAPTPPHANFVHRPRGDSVHPSFASPLIFLFAVQTDHSPRKQLVTTVNLTLVCKSAAEKKTHGRQEITPLSNTRGPCGASFGRWSLIGAASSPWEGATYANALRPSCCAS